MSLFGVRGSLPLTRFAQQSPSASFFNLLKSVDQHADLFACPGEDPVARRLRLMIDAAKMQLNALAQLAEHSDVIDVDFTVSEPMDLAPVA